MNHLDKLVNLLSMDSYSDETKAMMKVVVQSYLAERDATVVNLMMLSQVSGAITAEVAKVGVSFDSKETEQ